MEVEVKLRIPDSDSHQRLATLLSPFHLQTHLQENVFFDGARGELSSSRSVLRLRFYNSDSRCVVSLKGKAVIVDGVSRVEEVEEGFDVSLGRACVAEPWRLAAVDSGLVKRVVGEFRVDGFVCLGGFRNVRAVHEWQGLKLELDETRFDFGTSYEIECENDDPESAKRLLEGFLKENDQLFTLNFPRILVNIWDDGRQYDFLKLPRQRKTRMSEFMLSFHRAELCK